MGKLWFGALSFVVDADSVAGVGEPDGAVGVDRCVVGAVEGFAVEAVHEYGDSAVMLGSGDAAGEVFAGDEASLTVAAEGGYFAGDFAVSEHPVVGDVAED